jgi:hypothetical protein
MSEAAIPTPDQQPETGAGSRNRWRGKRRAEQTESAQAEPAQESVPPPAQPEPVPPAAPQLSEAERITREIASLPASQSDSAFAALPRDMQIDVLAAGGALGLNARAFTQARKNLWPALAKLDDQRWFDCFPTREIRLRYPIDETEVDWSQAAIRGPVTITVVGIRRDKSGALHKRPFVMTAENAGLIEKHGGASESELEQAILVSLGLSELGVRVRP